MVYRTTLRDLWIPASAPVGNEEQFHYSVSEGPAPPY